MAGVTGLISEQVWDSAPMPARRLCPGRPSGSAQPLVWAHAEHVKLIRSLADGAVFDMPPQTVKRYLKDHTRSPHRVWRFEGQVGELPHGTILRIETLAAARVHWTPDGWATAIDAPARDTGVGLYATDLPTAGLSVGTAVVFTFYWTSDDRWEESDFTLAVTAAV
jgi:glucoamylase